MKKVCGADSAWSARAHKLDGNSALWARDVPPPECRAGRLRRYRMKRFKLAALSGVWAVTMIATAIAQDTPPADPQGKPLVGETVVIRQVVWTTPATRWLKETDLKGKDVYTASGEKVGDIEDLILDMDSGRILYGIAKFEGKRVAIPGTALRLAPDSNRFDLSVSKEQLRAAAYEEKNTPNFADRAWATRNFTSFGLHPYWDN